MAEEKKEYDGASAIIKYLLEYMPPPDVDPHFERHKREKFIKDEVGRLRAEGEGDKYIGTSGFSEKHHLFPYDPLARHFRDGLHPDERMEILNQDIDLNNEYKFLLDKQMKFELEGFENKLNENDAKEKLDAELQLEKLRRTIFSSAGGRSGKSRKRVLDPEDLNLFDDAQDALKKFYPVDEQKNILPDRAIRHLSDDKLDRMIERSNFKNPEDFYRRFRGKY